MGLITYALNTDINAKIDLSAPENLTFKPHHPVHILQYGNPESYVDVTSVCQGAFEPITQIAYEPDEKDPIVEIITMDGIYFDFDSSQLSAAAKSQIAAVAAKLQENPKHYVEIHGHTDNVGSMRYNQWLSERRANAAAEGLKGLGISAARVFTSGHSFLQPVADNATKEGRSKNRRVEFVIRLSKDAGEQ